MKILIITVAGMSSRFSESVNKPCLKCIYHENGIEQSLLYQIIHKECEFDKYIIVGGFKYEELQQAVSDHFSDYADKIVMVKNDHFSDYGSGYSLYLGLKAAQEFDYDEIMFAEGDLFVDSYTFSKVYASKNNVVTANSEPILASKAVAFYYDEQYKIHYIYDTNHSALQIKVPFLGIFNSGQIWKFVNKKRLEAAAAALSKEQWQGTNLELIQQYFGELSQSEYEIIAFKEWINCNTVEDYRKSLK